ncbi:MAG TPA: DUF1553 domain-containing protein [Gemmataceae bacterium]|jgi:hypothetical protein
MLRYTLRALILTGLLIPFLQKACGAPPALDASALSARIDQWIDERLVKEKIPPARPTDDAEFFRRLSLDLNGRIPSLSQLADFLDDTRPDKRRHWIDELMDGPDNAPLYVKHLTHFWRRQLLAQTPPQSDSVVAPLESWLRKQVKANTPYDRLVRGLLTDPEAVGFFLANENKAENLASRTSRLLLGVKLECAQCHDDRSGGKWKQTQFWEFAAFFGGLRRDSSDPIVATPLPQKAGPARIRVSESKTWVKTRFPDGREPSWEGTTTPRQALAEWITHRDNPWFARAAVNRLWHYFFGIGLIDPVDGLGLEDNRPSHPELLDELVDQFVAHDFDLKYLIRATTLSRTYQRTSKQTHPRQDEKRLFARASARALTAEQLHDSLVLVTGYRPARTSPAAGRAADSSPRVEFLAPFDDPDSQPADFQASVQQVLMMMNGKFTEEVTSSSRSTSVAAIIDSQRAGTLAKRIEDLYLVTLSRKPRPHEAKRLLEYAEAHENKQALRDIFWSLLNSTEFVLNH